MIETNEVITLILGIGGLGFILLNKLQLKRLPEIRILLASFSFLILGWIMTVFENLWLTRVFNFLEHFCYAVSSLLVLTWCWKIFRKKGRKP